MSDDLVATLETILERLEALGIPYMIVGSIAALAHGRARSTQDFDLVVDIDAERAAALVDALPADRFYASKDAALDAVRRSTMFNVIDLKTGWKIGLVPLKRRPFSAQEFRRRQPVELLGVRAYVATIEDVVLAKLEWSKSAGGSARQIDDARELVRVAGATLDVAYVDEGAEELGVVETWRTLRPR